MVNFYLLKNCRTFSQVALPFYGPTSNVVGQLSQLSRSVVSDSATHEPQHARPPCPSPTPGVHPDPCPLSQWCHPTISSSVVPFSSCPQSFPASGSFQMSQLSTSGAQSIRVSASTSVPPVNTQDSNVEEIHFPCILTLSLFFVWAILDISWYLMFKICWGLYGLGSGGSVLLVYFL